MNRAEFLGKLQQALENDISPQAVRENLEYYSQYIRGELAKGRSEQEVLDELGDPWVIAQNIIDVETNKKGGQNVFESSGRQRGDSGCESRSGYGGYEGYGRDAQGGPSDEWTGRPGIHTFTIGSWWQRLLLLLVIVGILVLIGSIVLGILHLIAPVLVPLLLIVIAVRLLTRRAS